MQADQPVIGPVATGVVPAVGTSDTICSGWTVRETGGTNPVTVIARVGGASGALLGAAVLLAGASKEFFFGDDVICKGGIHVTITGTGVPESAFFVE